MNSPTAKMLSKGLKICLILIFYKEQEEQRVGMGDGTLMTFFVFSPIVKDSRILFSKFQN